MNYASQRVLIGTSRPGTLECRNWVCVLAGSPASLNVNEVMPYSIFLGMLTLETLPAAATVTTNGTHNSPSKKPFAWNTKDAE
jgi:hypothetical protein